MYRQPVCTPALLASLMFLSQILLQPAAFAGTPGPNISRVQPNAANIAGGNSVLIIGSGFLPLQSVLIGAQPATVIRSSDTELFVTTPAMPEGTYDVVVQSAAGTRTLSNAFSYRLDHDISRDFSATLNPVGVWRYGLTTNSNPVFTPATGNAIVGCVDTWEGSGSLPSIARNRTDSTCSQFTWTWPAGLIGLHPGNGAERVVIRFTAPSTAVYELAGQFVCIDSAVNGTVNAYIHRNLTEPLLTAAINQSHVPRPINMTVALNAGDTLDFSIDNGGNGLDFDQMVIDARIQPIVFASSFED